MHLKFKVAFDSQIFIAQTYGGVSRYFNELIRELDARKSFSVILVAPFYINNYINSSIASGIYFPSICKLVSLKFLGANKYFIFNLERLISIFLSYIYLIAKRPDIIHETYYLPFKIGLSRAIRVLTVYDMIHELFPDMFGNLDLTSNFKRLAVERADHIICISNATKNDLMHIFGVPEGKISVVYLAPSIKALGIDDDISLGESTRPYLLYVGSRGGYKNFIKFLNAFVYSEFLKDNYDIICFGGGAFNTEECKLLNQYGLLSQMDSRVKYIFGDDLLLGKYYKNASVFVYPSIYEGFGLPPLEAMSYDCPVACSHTSSIPEVVGDAASYFDPEDIASMAAAIEKVLLEPSFRNELVRKGRQQLTLFSWEKCAMETERIYTELINQHR